MPDLQVENESLMKAVKEIARVSYDMVRSIEIHSRNASRLDGDDQGEYLVELKDLMGGQADLISNKFVHGSNVFVASKVPLGEATSVVNKMMDAQKAAYVIANNSANTFLRPDELYGLSELKSAVSELRVAAKTYEDRFFNRDQRIENDAPSLSM